MNKEHVEEKKELIHALCKDRKLSEIPKIPQPTMIIWGDKDQVFPLELGYRLKRFDFQCVCLTFEVKGEREK